MQVIRAVEKAGYGAQVKGTEQEKKSAGSISAKLAAEEDALKDRETPRLRKRLVRSVLWLIVLMYFTMGHNMLGLPVPAPLQNNHLGLALTQMLIAIIVMYINRDFFVSGFRGLVRLKCDPHPHGRGALPEHRNEPHAGRGCNGVIVLYGMYECPQTESFQGSRRFRGQEAPQARKPGAYVRRSSGDNHIDRRET